MVSQQMTNYGRSGVSHTEQVMKAVSGAVASFLIVFLYVSLTACGGESSQSDYMQRAQGHVEEGALQSAVIELKNAIVKYPQNAEVRNMLANVYMQLGDVVSAEKELEQSWKLGFSKEDNIDVYAESLWLQGRYTDLTSDKDFQQITNPERLARVQAYQAGAYLVLQKPEIAELLIASASEVIPEDPLLITNTAILSAVLGDNEQAVSLLTNLLAKNPDYAQAWTILGNVQNDLLNYEESLRAYDNAIKAGQGQLGDHLRKIFLLFRIGELERARESVDLARKAHTQNPLLDYADGYLSYINGDYEAAETFLTKTNRAGPEYMPAVFYLGATHYYLGNLEQASQLLNQFYTQNPTDRTAVKLLALTSIRLENYERAEEILSSYSAAQTEDPEMLKLMAALAVLQGFPPELPITSTASTMGSPALEVTSAGSAPLQVASADDSFLSGQLSEAEIVAKEISAYLSYMNNGEFDEALRLAQEMTKSRPDDSTSWTFLAGAQLALGDTQAAKSSFRHALEVDPGDVNATANLARTLIREGDTPAAADLYARAIEQDPKYLPFYFALADLASIEGKPEFQLKWLEMAVSSNPDSGAAHFQLSRLYAKNGDMKSAQEQIKLALESEPEHLDSGLVQARWLTDAGDYEAARSLLNRLTVLYPTNAELLAQRGYLALREGKLEEAARNLRAAETGLPSAEIAMYLAQTYQLQGNDALALEKLSDASKRFPDDSRPLFIAANIHMLSGDTSLAAPLYERVLELSPSNLVALNNLAVILTKDNPAQALVYAEKAYSLKPDDVNIQDTLAVLELERSQFDRALELLASAVADAPDNQTVNYHYAKALIAKGETAKAKRVLERILKIEGEWQARVDAEKLLKSLG